jgi:hypothetical protein
LQLRALPAVSKAKAPTKSGPPPQCCGCRFFSCHILFVDQFVFVVALLLLFVFVFFLMLNWLARLGHATMSAIKSKLMRKSPVMFSLNSLAFWTHGSVSHIARAARLLVAVLMYC